MKTAKEWYDEDNQELYRIFLQDSDEACIEAIEKIQKDAFETGILYANWQRRPHTPDELWAMLKAKDFTR